MTTYQTLYAFSALVTIALALWTGISAAGGEKLGLSMTAMAWLTIIFGALGTLNGFLPPLQRWPVKDDNAGPRKDPDPMPRDE